MEQHLIEQMMGIIQDASNFPIHKPLFTGTTEYIYDSVVGLTAAFQKVDGGVTVFFLRWNTSYDYLENGYHREDHDSLKALFCEHPQYIELVQPGVVVVEEKKEEQLCEILPGAKCVPGWRTLWGLLSA